MVRLGRIVIVLALLWGVGTRCAHALGPMEQQDLPPTDLERVNVGTLAPDFLLKDEKGNSITLSQFREKSSVILIFYRGHW